MTILEKLQAFWIKFAFAIVLAHAFTPHVHASALPHECSIHQPVHQDNWLQDFFGFNVGEEHLEHIRASEFGPKVFLFTPAVVPSLTFALVDNAHESKVSALAVRPVDKYLGPSFTHRGPPAMS